MHMKLILSILKLRFELESSVKSMNNTLASLLGLLTLVGCQKDAGKESGLSRLQMKKKVITSDNLLTRNIIKIKKNKF